METTNLEERIWRKTTNKNIQSLGSTPSFAPTSLATFSIYYGTRRPGYLVTEQQTFFTGVCVCSVAQLCPALCDPMDCSPPGSSVHGILQARIQEWAAMPSSRGSSQPRKRTSVPFASPALAVQFSSVTQSCPTLATPWTAACQASLSITSSRSLLKLMCIESVMPSSHLILCCPLLLLPPIAPSIRVFFQ